jgi:hypothetical protein
MNPRLFRLIAGFLAAFVLLSYAPFVPDLVREFRWPAGILAPGDVLLAAAAALTLMLLLLVLRRRRLVPPSVRRPVRPAGPAPASAMLGELRRRAEQGERVPALARRYRLSQDAVRVAVGGGPSSPAARAERVSRARQRALPAPVPRVHPPVRATAPKPYRAIG